MVTFDGWEDQLYGPNTLAHFRTKGSKNGVRRFQNEDGTWTPLGLRERKEREGWGDKEARRAAKKQAKAERKAQKAARVEAYREQKRKSNVKTMTDEELSQKISRLKMEQEYKELNRSPLLKAGEKLVSGYMNYRIKRDEAENTRKKMALELKRLETENIKSKERTKQSVQEAKKAKSEAKKTKADVKGGLVFARKAELKNAKTNYRGTTLRGNIARAIGTKLNAGLKEKHAAIRAAEGRVTADKIQKNAKRAEANAERREQNKWEREQEKRQLEQYRFQERAAREQEKESRKRERRRS